MDTDFAKTYSFLVLFLLCECWRLYWEPMWHIGNAVWPPKDEIDYNMGCITWRNVVMQPICVWLFVQQEFHRLLYLSILTLKQIVGRQEAFDVRLQLLVFEQLSSIVHRSHLRYAEYIVAYGFPPYSSHGTRHRCTHQFAYTQFVVQPWGTVGIGIVVLTDEHAGGFHPAVEGVVTDILSAWHVFDASLAREQFTHIVV